MANRTTTYSPAGNPNIYPENLLERVRNNHTRAHSDSAAVLPHSPPEAFLNVINTRAYSPSANPNIHPENFLAAHLRPQSDPVLHNQVRTYLRPLENAGVEHLRQENVPRRAPRAMLARIANWKKVPQPDNRFMPMTPDDQRSDAREKQVQKRMTLGLPARGFYILVVVLAILCIIALAGIAAGVTSSNRKHASRYISSSPGIALRVLTFCIVLHHNSWYPSDRLPSSSLVMVADTCQHHLRLD